MSFNSVVDKNGAIIIATGDRLTIEAVGEFAQILTESLGAAKEVYLEFDPELVIDITGVQLICAACKTASREGSVFSFRGLLPSALVGMVERSGIQRNAPCKHNNNSTCIWFGGSE